MLEGSRPCRDPAEHLVWAENLLPHTEGTEDTEDKNSVPSVASV